MEKETFLKAKPIWLNSLTNKLNSAALFKVTLNKLTNATLKITASSFYRVFVNNHFIAYGPARAAHNYFRVDYISLPLNLNDNEIVIEVVGYKCNSYYCLKQDPFLIAEIIKNNEVIKATGYDFKAKDYKEKIERVARFSFQRAFLEIYDFTLAKSEYSFNDIITLENRNYISRNVDYPLFEEANCKYIESGSFKINPLSKMERNRTLVATSSLSYNINELDDYSFDLLNDALYTKENKKEFISENEYETYKCDYSITGFIKIEFEVIENSDVILTYSEINSSNDISKPIDVDYKRNDTINIIRYKANKSNFSYISIEPYTLRYLKVNVIKGKIKVKHISIIKYENPDTNKLKFKANDIKLEKIVEASKHVLEQNAVDILTDCPSRERAGWLCDSLFSSRAEKLFTGENKVEENFLENYYLHPSFTDLGLPSGAIGMCYPAEYDDYVYIPNWMLFYIIELKENYLRTKNERLKEESYPIANNILKFLKQFENEYGLLEDLPGWVFVEWSKANSYEFMKGVNFPTNMLYQKAIKDFAYLYDSSLLNKANSLKNEIIKHSYNGTFFVDNAIRENNKLVKTNNISETCQYYALYFEIASIDEYKNLYKTLLNDFGPLRNDAITYPNIYKSNAFIGNILRYSILVNNGQTNKFLDEAKDYYYNMAKVTKTLWEHSELTCSLNHGFNSYVANLIVESLTGFTSVDELNYKIHIKDVSYITDYDIKIPCKEGYIHIYSKDQERCINYPKKYTIDGGENNA